MKAACTHGVRAREFGISSLEASVGGKFKNDHARANARDTINMADNNIGFSASGSSAALPSAQPPIASPQLHSLARNAAEFREPPPASAASAPSREHVGSSPARGVGGSGDAPGGAPEGPQHVPKRRRVVICSTCGQHGHMAKTCGRCPAVDSASAPLAATRGRGGGVLRRAPRPPEMPYDDDDEADILAEDADDIHIEIGSYKFQDGDFTWHEVEVPTSPASSATDSC